MDMQDQLEQAYTEAQALLNVVIDVMVSDVDTSSEDVAIVLMRVRALLGVIRKTADEGMRAA